MAVAQSRYVGLLLSGAVAMTTMATTIVAGVVVVATPAHAVVLGQTYYNRYLGGNKNLQPANDRVNGPVVLDNWHTGWKVTNRGTVSGHSIVQMQSLTTPTQTDGRCLDSHASAAGGAAWGHSCNSGDYQRWEVFKNTNNNTITFKSRGAYTLQRRHLCLAATNDGRAVMAVCDVTNARQQWY